jgi:acetyl-CoA carboxylase biotin carboxyl carrier protein
VTDELERTVPGTAGEPDAGEPTSPTPDAGAGEPAGPTSSAAATAAGEPGRPTPDAGDSSLLALLDRLTGLLERSDLIELEVEAGQTGLVLRKPAAVFAPPAIGPVTATATASGSGSAPGSASEAPATAGPPARPSVKAPLTGIFYTSPGPGSSPYVQAGGEIVVGQVIGLIEAMKLFHEIKSDLAGRVVRVVAESGQLVKAKQPLIEVEPL